jgi:hypothetical protein
MAVIEAIATTYLEADAASVTFSGIPTTYEHLQIRMSSRNTLASTTGNPTLEFNGTAGTAYSSHSMNAFNTTPDSDSSETGDGSMLTPKQTTGATANATDFASAIIDILDYRNALKNTTVMAISGSGITTAVPYVSFASGLFDDTTVITSITLDSNGSWMRGSVFTLYGLNSS